MLFLWFTEERHSCYAVTDEETSRSYKEGNALPAPVIPPFSKTLCQHIINNEEAIRTTARAIDEGIQPGKAVSLSRKNSSKVAQVVYFFSSAETLFPELLKALKEQQRE